MSKSKSKQRSHRKRSKRKTWLWIGGLAAGGLALWWYLERRKAKRAAEAAAKASATGSPAVEPPPPRRQSGADETATPVFVEDESEALARVIASEAGDEPPEVQARVAWTARNRARGVGTTIAKLVAQPCGRRVPEVRPFSTRRPAAPAHRELAVVVLAAPDRDDPTRGATHVLDVATQDRLYETGRSARDAAAVRQERLASLDYYGSAGGLDFFGPRGGPGARPSPC